MRLDEGLGFRRLPPYSPTMDGLKERLVCFERPL